MLVGFVERDPPLLITLRTDTHNNNNNIQKKKKKKKMVRTPGCDKSGVKKGTWTAEEDRKLIAYVTRYGCWNWRQLPKYAGLARCGKSCRLRWLNYLRPNIKRGDYTPEEEQTIINLHHKLGNRWSTIAAQLPGRTDNDIKNHWHTNLKKRSQEKTEMPQHDEIESKQSQPNLESSSSSEAITVTAPSSDDHTPLSPQSYSSCEFSSTTTISTLPNNDINQFNNLDFLEDDDHFAFLQAYTNTTTTYGNFWTDPNYVDHIFCDLTDEILSLQSQYSTAISSPDHLQLWTHNI